MDLLLIIAGLALLIWSETRKAGMIVLTMAAIWIAMEIALVFWIMNVALQHAAL